MSILNQHQQFLNKRMGKWWNRFEIMRLLNLNSQSQQKRENSCNLRASRAPLMAKGSCEWVSEKQKKKRSMEFSAQSSTAATITFCNRGGMGDGIKERNPTSLNYVVKWMGNKRKEKLNTTENEKKTFHWLFQATSMPLTLKSKHRISSSEKFND